MELAYMADEWSGHS